ncbi:hypothetical protein WJX72_001948 [[Myrmecia] bisecta]|uniref:Complex III subunit 9 n=1 Tax=[Myrmecia] bisecta TaxID=41462 RepID=A0AAW1Q542_9CHLO
MATQSAPRSPSSPLLDAGYKLLMRRNAVYVAFILGGAIIGERVVDYSINKLWEKNNQGKLYKHLEGTVIGGEKAEEE